MKEEYIDIKEFDYFIKNFGDIITKEFIEIYNNDIKNHLNHFCVLKENNDYSNILFILHSIKGVVSIFGALKNLEYIKQMEIELKKENYEEFELLYPLFIEAQKQFDFFLNKIINEK